MAILSILAVLAEFDLLTVWAVLVLLAVLALLAVCYSTSVGDIFVLVSSVKRKGQPDRMAPRPWPCLTGKAMVKRALPLCQSRGTTP